ncbi:MAG TPA: hypothetical protein VGN42_03355 [Pirellulales bacterium]|nr:hypothetical protein [Pirellulales bacterium]
MNGPGRIALVLRGLPSSRVVASRFGGAAFARLVRRMAAPLAGFALLFGFRPAMAPSRAEPPENAAAAKQENEATPKGKATDAPAKGRFSFGSTVEVLALGTHDANPDRWWDEQGKPLVPLPAPLVGCFFRQRDEQGQPLPSVPVTWRSHDNVASPDPVWRRIVFRIRDLPDDAAVTWNIVAAHATGDVTLVVRGDQAPKGYFSRYFGVAADQKTTGLKVGVASGPWKTAAKSQPFAGLATGRANGKSLVFSAALETADGTVIVVSHNYVASNFRVVAFDKRGTLHRATSGRGGSAGPIHQAAETFAELKRDDIDRFEFQTRDYEYVELARLPLEPAAETEEPSETKKEP